MQKGVALFGGSATKFGRAYKKYRAKKLSEWRLGASKRGAAYRVLRDKYGAVGVRNKFDATGVRKSLGSCEMQKSATALARYSRARAGVGRARQVVGRAGRKYALKAKLAARSGSYRARKAGKAVGAHFSRNAIGYGAGALAVAPGYVVGRRIGRKIGKSSSMARGDMALRKATTTIPKGVASMIHRLRRSRKTLSIPRLAAEQVRRGRTKSAFRTMLAGKRGKYGRPGAAGTRGESLASRIQFRRLVRRVASDQRISEAEAIKLVAPKGIGRTAQQYIAARSQSVSNPVNLYRKSPAFRGGARLAAAGGVGYGIHRYTGRDTKKSISGGDIHSINIHPGAITKVMLTRES